MAPVAGAPGHTMPATQLDYGVMAVLSRRFDAPHHRRADALGDYPPREDYGTDEDLDAVIELSTALAKRSGHAPDALARHIGQ